MDHPDSRTQESPAAGFRPVVGAPPPPPPPVQGVSGADGSALDGSGPTGPTGPDGPGGPRPAAPTRPLAPTQRIHLARRLPRPRLGLPRQGQAGPAQTTLAGLIQAMRPKQWTKNILVFAAPGAAGVLFHPVPLLHALAAFALFCAVASGSYLLNDALDAPADREHPVKRSRPVASGVVSVRLALAVAGGLMAVGIALGGLLRPQLALVLGIYAVLQIAYSSYLKHLPIYDITCVSAGFLLRAIAGAVAIPVAISEWFLIVATFGSLLMVTGKRLAEHAELGEGRGGHRSTLDAYTIGFLRIVVATAATGAVVGYALWAFGLEAAAVSVHHHDGIFFQLSIIPVLLALLHFTLLIERGAGARPEDLVLGDRQFQLLGAVWLLLFALGVYG